MNETVSLQGNDSAAGDAARLFADAMAGRVPAAALAEIQSRDPRKLDPLTRQRHAVLLVALWLRALGHLATVASGPLPAPTWRESLRDARLGAILCRLRSEAASGYLIARAGPVLKVVCVVDGYPRLINSNVKREQLASLLPEEVRSAVPAGARPEELIAALLGRGLSTPEALADLFTRQAAERFADLFSYPSGDIELYETAKVPKVAPLLTSDWMELMRSALSRRRGLDAAALRERVQPLVAPGVRTTLLDLPAAIAPELSVSEATVVRHLKGGTTPAQLVAAAEQHSEEGKASVLRALFLLWQLGLLRPSAAPAAAAPAPRLATLPKRPNGASGSNDASGSTPLPRGPINPFVPAAARPAAASSPKTPTTGEGALAEFKAQQRLEVDAKELLFSYRVPEAITKLEELVNRRGQSGPALAYLALAYTLRNGPADQKRALAHVQKALDADSDDALAHAVFSRVLAATERRAEAAIQKRKAEALSGGNRAWQAEVKQALEATAKPQKARRFKLQMPTSTVAPWLIFAAVPVAMFVGAIVMEYGGTEYFYSWPDPFFAVRRVTLAVAALVGLMLTLGVGPWRVWREIGFSLRPIGYVVFAFAYGLGLGYISPPQAVRTDFILLTVMTLAHVVAEELYFRGFALRLLLDRLIDYKLAIVLSAGYYGLYHLTFYSFWVETPFSARFFWCGMIGLLAGVPYAILYERTRSIVAPIICHASVSLLMMWMSILRFS